MPAAQQQHHHHHHQLLLLPPPGPLQFELSAPARLHVGGAARTARTRRRHGGPQRHHHAADALGDQPSEPQGGARFVLHAASLRADASPSHLPQHQPLASLTAATQPAFVQHQHHAPASGEGRLRGAWQGAAAPASCAPALHEQQQQQHLQSHQQQQQRPTAKQKKEALAAIGGERSDPFLSAKLLLAGALSAVVSRTCVAPLERVKMELMLKQGAKGGAWATAVQVMSAEGVRGFWKGNLLNLLRTAPFKALNFSSFDTLHRALVACSGVDGNGERFVAGALAGVTATLVCFPLDVVRTRLMSRATRAPHYGAGPLTTLVGILRHEGPRALYSGCLPAVVGMAPAGAVFYGVYDALKHRHLHGGPPFSPPWPPAQHQDALEHRGNRQQQQDEEEERQGGRPALLASTRMPLEATSRCDAAAQPSAPRTAQAAAAEPARTLPTAYTLLYGAVAGACSELLVYPLEVVRRRMQMQAMAAAAQATMRPSSPGAAAVAASAQQQQRALAAALTAAAAQQQGGGSAVARVAAAAAAVLRSEGLRGFYTGLAPNMLQVLPSAALSYWTYESAKTLLGVRV